MIRPHVRIVGPSHEAELDRLAHDDRLVVERADVPDRRDACFEQLLTRLREQEIAELARPRILSVQRGGGPKPGEREMSESKVHVRVDEAGQHGAAGEIDRPVREHRREPRTTSVIRPSSIATVAFSSTAFEPGSITLAFQNRSACHPDASIGSRQRAVKQEILVNNDR